MDLALLTTSDTADCVIIDPYTGDETEIVITVYGIHTQQFRDGVKLYPSDEQYSEFLAHITQDWTGVELEGKTLKYNKDNAIKAYSTSIVLRNQVSSFIKDLKAFLPRR